MLNTSDFIFIFFFFQAEDGIRDWSVNGVQTCALPILQDGAPETKVALRLSSKRASHKCLWRTVLVIRTAARSSARSNRQRRGRRMSPPVLGLVLRLRADRKSVV